MSIETPWPEEVCTWVNTKEFHERCLMLFEFFDAGELVTAQSAAEFIGLPFPVFRELFGTWLALEEFKGNATIN